MFMHVTSTPYPDRVDEFDHWYSSVHVPDMLAVPVVKSCRRFRLVSAEGPVRFLAVYEFDRHDPAALLAELVARSADGRMRPGSASDPTAALVEFWESCAEVAFSAPVLEPVPDPVE
ncbi:hypothetical protein ACWDOP_02505 [Nocardia sp. NPDC003693]